MKIFIAFIAVFLTFNAWAEGISSAQADAILKELRSIHQLLEQQAGDTSKKNTNAPESSIKVDVKGAISVGKSDAPLTMVMFTDYQCPFCRRFEMETYPELEKQYINSGRLKFVIRDLPLSFHSMAKPAAEAVLCAEEQGQGWEFRKKLTQASASLDSANIYEYAKASGLNLDSFSACQNTHRYASRLDESVAEAKSLGISGTPTFVIGREKGNRVEGTRIVGALPLDTFRKAIEKATRTSP